MDPAAAARELVPGLLRVKGRLEAELSLAWSKCSTFRLLKERNAYFTDPTFERLSLECKKTVSNTQVGEVCLSRWVEGRG